MNIQIYTKKRGFDVQKAERYFKERRIPYQFVDLARHAPGIRELKAIAAQVGINALVDTESAEYKTHYIGHITDEDAIIAELAARPGLIKAPIVRNGKFATVGYHPEVWSTWS